jgi:hydrogenase expression/formation protein HypC
VPGRVTRVEPNPLGVLMGTVDFGGVSKEVCLDYLPDVRVGEYVIVHVGFAISKVDEAEAKQVFELLRTMGELEEFEPPAGGSASPRAAVDEAPAPSTAALGSAAPGAPPRPADTGPPPPASRGTPRPAGA